MSTLGIAHGQTVPGSPIVSDVPVANGTERVPFLGTQGARALLVLLPGSDAIVGLDGGGGVHQLGGNCLVGTIGQWVAQGFDVVLPDAPNGSSLLGQRHLPAYADAINRAIDFGRAHADLPVWLIAANQGSTAAVSAAAHLCSKISGAVLASSVTRPGRAGETLFDADLGAIVVPVLVVNNQYDSCRVSPPGDAPNVLAARTHSPRKELVMVGSSKSTDAPTPARGCRRTAISGSREWWCSVSPTGSERYRSPVTGPRHDPPAGVLL
jgi:hypothetical protein